MKLFTVQYTQQQEVTFPTHLNKLIKGRSVCQHLVVTLKSNTSLHSLLLFHRCNWLKTKSQGNLHYMWLHFLKLEREFFCVLITLRGTILCRLASLASSLGWLVGNKPEITCISKQRRYLFRIYESHIFNCGLEHIDV